MSVIKYNAVLTAAEIDENQRESQARATWINVKTQAAWDSLTGTQRTEAIRRFMKAFLKDKYGDKIT